MKAQNPLRSFLFGLTLPITALRVILSRPSLMLWSVVPIGITFTLYAFLFSRLKDFVSHGWNLELWYLQAGSFILNILIFLIAAITFSFAANLVSTPFNDFLAEKSERFAIPPLPAVPNPSFLLRIRLITLDLMKTLFAAMLALASLVLSWIPLLNVLAAEFAFLLVCFQFISFPQTRRGQGISHGMKFLFGNIFACTGFGMAFSLIFSIPVVSALCLPLAVVGGTLLVAQAQGSKET